MSPNLLVTGPPRSGKTTVIQRTQERLAERNCQVGGIYCPELREAGVRTIDTAFVEQESDVAFQAVLDEHGWEQAVVKPAVGTSSDGVFSVSRESLQRTRSEYETLWTCCARVDGIERTGELRLMELELIGPYLGLGRAGTVEQFADAIYETIA